jgi:Fe-S cluster biogenesis protein NfuA
VSFLDRIFGAREPRPTPEPTGDALRIAEVEAILAELRPLFVADGGDISLLAVADDGRVTVRLVGACNTCHASPMTLRGALEPRMRERLTWFGGLDAE